MTAPSLALIVALLGAALLCARPLGLYIANVMEGRPIWPLRAGARLESVIYRLCAVDPAASMGWKQYAVALMLFNALGALALYALQRLQPRLPLNPQQFTDVSPDSSFNTAVSFATNTNWQGYSGESTMSYLTQMLGLAVQNFLSAASGIVVAIVLIRGFALREVRVVGNFWVDVTRSTLYILLPIAFVLALVFISQGVIQNFSAYREVTTLEPLVYWQAKIDAAGKRYPADPPLEQSLRGSDLAVAQWVADHGRQAGLGTDTLAAAPALYVPFGDAERRLGVMAVLPSNARRVLLPEQRHLLETFAGQIGIALERAQLADSAESVRVAAERETLRNTLLASISHDLRTPLAAMAGAGSTLAEQGASLDEGTRRSLARSIETRAREMSELISNVLDLMRLESGRIALRLDWQMLDDLLQAALAAFGPRLAHSGRHPRHDLCHRGRPARSRHGG